MISNSIISFSKELRILIGVFLIVLSIGYFTGIVFVESTTNFSVNGIEETYLGNEQIEDAEIMKFKKSKRGIITLIHTHILSLSVIFFIVGLLLQTSTIKPKHKLFLSIEPFISLIVTFGGIYLLWSGVLWMKYVIIISGVLMTLSYTFSVIILMYQLFFKPQK
jgi:hypothetical protein